MENESLTHYMRVAVSLAERIAAGELREGEKLSGRSKLSPEYNVSPETVRRALRLLADMKVVEVKEQSGVYILSADNARRYLHLCAGRNDLQEKQRRLRRLLAQQEQLHRQVTELCTAILDETGRTPESLPNYSCRIPETWAGSGKTVGELQFWQQTGATIVAIHRNLDCIVSPRPLCRAVRRRQHRLRRRRAGPRGGQPLLRVKQEKRKKESKRKEPFRHGTQRTARHRPRHHRRVPHRHGHHRRGDGQARPEHRRLLPSAAGPSARWCSWPPSAPRSSAAAA